MKTAIFAALFASVVTAAPFRRAAECKDVLVNFDDASLGAPDNTKLVDIPGALSGFIFDDFRIASCPGAGCKSFPAESMKQFTGPHMGMLEGLVGGLINKELQLKTSPKGVFRLEDANGSFDLGDFDVFDIIDLPEQVKLGAKQDMRVHLDCKTSTGGANVKKTIPFPRNKDSAGYSVTKALLGPEFVELKECEITTTQVFFPLGVELEIPTESMGLDNFNACVR